MHPIGLIVIDYDPIHYDIYTHTAFQVKLFQGWNQLVFPVQFKGIVSRDGGWGKAMEW
jgi:hypothetical protein